MRGFIAIPLTDFVRAEVEELLSALPIAAGIKAAPPENLHITLRFLGEIEGKPLEKTVKILAEIAGETAPFAIEFQSLGQFPRRGMPKSLWLGIKPSPELEALGAKIREKVPYGDDKPFSPHITLARVKQFGPEEAAYVDAFYRQKSGAFTGQQVGAFALMESILRPKAPEYSIGWEFILKDGVD